MPTEPISKSDQPAGIVAIAAVTVSGMVKEFTKLPAIPVTVSVESPVTAELLAAMVKMLDVPALAGLKEAVIPLGRPGADKLTVPVKPFCAAMLIAVEAFPPWAMVK